MAATGGVPPPPDCDKRVGKLTCTICLELFRSPRLLPCYHTFCLECLEDIASRHNNRAFPCPTCRRTTQVPAGGVKEFQVNFYLEDDAEEARSQEPGKEVRRPKSISKKASGTPRRNTRQWLEDFFDDDSAGFRSELFAGIHIDEEDDPTDFCKQHPDEKLRFACLACGGQVICRDSKLTRHEGHKTDDMATQSREASLAIKAFKRSLDQQAKLAKMKRTNSKRIEEMAEERRQAIVSLVRGRADSLREWVDKCADEVVGQIDRNFETNIEQKLQANVQDAEMYVSILKRLQELRNNHLTDKPGGKPANVNFARMLQGRDEDLKTFLCEIKADSYLLPYFLAKDDLVVHDKIKDFLCAEFLHAEFPFCRTPLSTKSAFEAFDAARLIVYSICPLSGDQTRVCVAYGPDEPGSDGRVALFNSIYGDNEWEEDVKGKVSLASIGEDKVRAIGQDFAKVFDPAAEQSFDAHLQVDGKIVGSVALDVLSTGKLRFAVYHEGGQAILVSEKVIDLASNPVVIDRSSILALRRKVVAFDANSAGSLFGVVHEGDPHVYLYGRKGPDPLAKYDTKHEGSCPRALCFYGVCGQEVLVVADWGCSVVYTLSTDNDGLKFDSLLGTDCPEMLRPTALAADDEGGLWIGCQGGGIFLTQPSVTSSDNPSDDDDDDNDDDNDDKEEEEEEEGNVDYDDD